MKQIKLIPSLLFILVVTLIFFCGFTKENYQVPKLGYKVYLDGKELGFIDSKDQLYDLIDDEQREIKSEYNVDKVYPPRGFNINKYISYNDSYVTTESIYNNIKNSENFTIRGYKITIKKEDGSELVINVLDKKIFEDSIKNIIKSFINYDEYLNYLNDTQPEIVDVGEIIESLYFEETITIKDTLISVNDKIYTSVDDLTHFLLFGDNVKAEKYTVKVGDTIASIAEDNKLNSQEFLIANADLNLRDETSLLAVGEQVSIALINPVLSLTYDLTLVEDTTVYFSKETKYDYSKNSAYKEITQKGVNGITRNTQKVHMVNGDIMKAVIVNSEEIRKPITEITTRGRKYYNPNNQGTGQYIDLTGDWKWPTNQPYIITSPYGYRGGTIHEGIDISGTGYGSPIYAARGGIVAESYWQNTGGNVIIIDHQNGYFTMYAHLSNRLVDRGQGVSGGTRIGSMGCSGSMCTGTHLHFGAYNGRPYQGGKPFDPRKLYQ